MTGVASTGAPRTDVAGRGPAGAGRRTTVRSALLRVLNVGGALIAAVLIWQLLTSLLPSPYFPTPLAILQQAVVMLFSGPPSSLFLTSAVTVDIAQTVFRLLLGFVLGSAAGVFFGIVIGRSRAAREFSDPIVEFLRSIPATASLPLFVILLGGGASMRVAFIAYGVSWFVLINTANGVAAIHGTLLDMASIFKLSKRRVFFRVVIPAAAPRIFAGLRIALTGAVLLAVVSEFVLATNGIGFQLLQAQSSFALLSMWVWMVVLAVIGFVLNMILEGVELRVLRWYRLQR